MRRRIAWTFPLFLLQASAQAPDVCVIGGCHSECLNNPLLSNGRNSYPCNYNGDSFSSCPAAPNGVNYGSQITKSNIPSGAISQCGTDYHPSSYFFDAQHTDTSSNSRCYNNFAEYADAPVLAENVISWNDRTYYYTNVDPVLQGLKFTVGTHKSIKTGWVHYSTNYAGNLYVWAEKTCYTVECIRDGGFSNLDWASVGGELTDLTLSYDGETENIGVEGGMVRVYGDFAVWRVPMEAGQRLTIPVEYNLRWTGGMAFEPLATTTTTTTTATSTTTTTTTQTTTTTTTQTTTSTTSSTTKTGSTTTQTTTTITRTGTTTTVSTTTGTTTATSTTITFTGSTTTQTTTTISTTTTTGTSTTFTTTTISTTTTTTLTTTSTTRTTTTTTTTTTTVTTTTFHGRVLFESGIYFLMSADDCDASNDVVSTDTGKADLLTSIGDGVGMSTEYSTLESTACQAPPSRRLDGDLRGSRRLQTTLELAVVSQLIIGVAFAEENGITRETVANSGDSFASGLSDILSAAGLNVTILGVRVPLPTARIIWSDPDASTSTSTTTTTTTMTTTTASTTTGDAAAWDKPPTGFDVDGGAKEHAASGSNAILFLGTCAIMCTCSVCLAKRFWGRVLPKPKEGEEHQHEEDISHMSMKKSPKKAKKKKIDDQFGGISAVEIDIQPAVMFKPGRSMTMMALDNAENGRGDKVPFKAAGSMDSMDSMDSLEMGDDDCTPSAPQAPMPASSPRMLQNQANDGEYEKFSDSKSLENKSLEGGEAEGGEAQDSVAPLRHESTGPMAPGVGMSQVISLGEDSINPAAKVLSSI